MRFRRKERGTRVKDRGKSGEVKADSPLPRYLLHIVLTCIRQESENKWYRNTVKDLLLPNTVNQKDENRIPQGWMIPQYRTSKSKLPKYRLKKS